MIPRARWQRIQSLFEEVVDIAPEERVARLASSCQGDSELRDSVEALLASDQRTEDPLINAIGEAAESLLEEHHDRLLGTRIGPYRIVSILGQGGMSTVYRGERDDSQYQQTVAIKVLHHATLHPRLRSRLHSERHILATLDHPSIARLIDSGDLDDGTPYLVMEHVDGESIDVYCDSRTLFVRERLELFLQVCTAVQYAHRNLVVHRDIKAANIFVTGDGTAKLLDFGIAKLLAPESLSHTLPVTRLQERILTPENAAPEQVLGRPITTATDIYSLGVLLYQLLTGRSPYRLLSYSQLQLERAICMDDPVRPSQMVVSKLSGENDADRSRISDRRGLSPQRLRMRLSGDLDSIIGMAMRKEPDRRYPSVEAFAADLQRHLTGRPVLARQGDWRYHTAKFLRRHTLPAIGVAAVMVGLSVVAGVTLWQNHRIELARQATAQERDRAQQVSAFLVDVFSQADPFTAQGQQPTARDLLDRGAQKILSNSNLQPEVRAQLLESIGLAYRRQGLSERAVPLLEQAVAIRRDQRPLDEHRVAAALANLAQALTDGGHLVSAEAYLQQGLQMSRSGDDVPTVESADILQQFGQFELGAKSDPQAASKLFRESLEIYRANVGNQSPSVASILNNLADAEVWTGDYALAERDEREAIRIFQATVNRNHPDHATALENLGIILTERGKYREAEQMLSEALDIETNVFGANNQRVANIQSHLGILYDRQGDLPRAVQATRQAVKLATDKLGTSHYLTGYYLDSLANLYMRANDLAAAENYARQSLDVYAQSLPSRHLYVASTRQLLGDILVQRGKLAAAEVELRSAVDINTALAGAESWRTARSQASLGWDLILRDDAAEGEPMLVAARNRLVATVGAKHAATQWASSHLADYLRTHHRDAEAALVSATPH
ncbi:MAG: eukaryotic-like serine/threonine-protein kinase [Gammaproteobacteria bacterium]|jgi:serine/threonine protein kinase/tetratricopeptide (TPR) repeat protein|nr:eukaryotic-like serine/threonine-protein kinase [Gammaproteobacteria bacterium]